MEIRQIMQGIEAEHDVNILFAVENGSRAWGLNSYNSDYDVRFVFHRTADEYLRLSPPKDVIEYKPDDMMDVVGFDIFKFAKLLAKSNPSMIEWLMSDIVYYGCKNEVFLDFAKNEWNPQALFHHYRSMGKQNYYKYIKSGNYMSHKKYLYAMRGVINAQKVLEQREMPVMDFETEIKNASIPTDIRERLLKIIKLKREGQENDIVGNIPQMDDYIENFLKRSESVKLLIHKANVEPLNNEIESLLLNEEG